ncbi:hypothetical protein [Streptomyces sp. NPDC020298]|uniref:hypothetical protein n=1 Tax=unclassified Streptomyces TaxID=2593676 RepID=UPI0033E18DA0
MEREELERLLAGGDETSLAALAALRGGASHVVWDGTMPAEAYANVYRARLRRTVRMGTPTLGLERAVQLLGQHEEPIRLGQITAADGTWVFMLFLDQDGSGLVACTGVRRRLASP